MNTRLTFGSVALTAALTLLAVPSQAQAQVARQRYPDTPQMSGGVGYDNGYRMGIAQGERDAIARRDYDYQRDRAYRDADSGWTGYGDREWYRSQFRRGYTEGYRLGYERYARGGYGSGPSQRDDPRWGRSPGYPGGGYPGERYGYPGASYGRIAFDRGYRDGREEGVEAGRKSDHYDPYREKDYRKGENGYERRYGSKDDYKQQYRDGFVAGYERGYRDARGGYNRGGGWPW